MTRAMTLGVDHIGVGVSDMARSLAFWARLGFDEVVFDYSGEVFGPDIAERATARVVMIAPSNPTVLGPGAVKLVERTGDPIPAPAAIGWGERGVCEVCVHVKNQAGLYAELVTEGHVALMEPNTSPLDPFGTLCSLSYVQDPDGTKIELIEWLDLESGWPQADGPQGVNHVAFGVTSLERTRDFYRSIGFAGMVFDSDGYFAPMDSWYAPRTPPRQKMTLLTNPYGAGLEPVEHIPASPDMRGRWGHLGPFEFGVGVRNLELAIDALQKQGISLSGRPQTVHLPQGGTWRYAYFEEPDGNYVYLTEARY